MAGPLDLHTLAVQWLDACVEALNTVNIADTDLLGAPDRQFISLGPPAADCDQIVVFVPTLGELPTSPAGNAAGRRFESGWINQVGLVAVLVRCCAPSPEFTVGGDYVPPTPEAQTEFARQLNSDGWALWNHLHNKQAAGRLLPMCSNVEFLDVRPNTPSGGCGGWTARTQVTLDGYDEIFGT